MPESRVIRLVLDLPATSTRFLHWYRYVVTKSFSKSSSESLAPISVSQTDLFLFAGSEI